MEILKADFEASLPLLQKAITECDFVAMDTEMTGLASPANIPKFQDSLSTRYSKVSVSAANFLVIQLGICTFTWSDDIGGYEARPFNFPCFPSSADEAKAGERFFKCQSTSLEFLLNNGFDFNKWIRHGIPYLTRPEEEAYITRKTEKTALHAAVSTTSSNIPIDDRNREFIETTIAKIKEWLQSPGEPLTVSAPNSFFRRLVYQVVRTDFNDELHVTANAQARTMTIQQYTDEIRHQQEQAKLAKPPTLNLRRVLDMISDARKPLIGHNCFLDLMQISQQFLSDLPLELDDWKRALMLEWDTIIDTKHLAGHPLISPLLPSTALEVVSESVQKAPFATVGPKIVMAENFSRYLADASAPGVTNGATEESVTKGEEAEDDTKYHEAGYDAYITGQAFLRFAGYIIKEHQKLMDEDEEHTRKKRRLMDGDIEVDNVFARAIQAVREVEPASLKARDEKQEADEEEEGEVLETETEKDAILEKRKRVIMDNPTTEILEMEELRDYYNLLHMMRSDIPVMNLAGPDQEPEERPWCFLLKNIPPAFQTSTLFHLFRSYNPFRFNWIDGTSASIQLSQRAPAVEGEEPSREPYEPTPLPLGRLGEEYVNPLCMGGEDAAVRGRSAGIVPEAANIEVVSWKAWYEEREVLERQARDVERERHQQSQQQAQEVNGRGFKWSNRGGAASSASQAGDGQGLGSGLPEREGVAAAPTAAATSAHTVPTKRKHGEDHAEHSKDER